MASNIPYHGAGIKEVSDSMSDFMELATSIGNPAKAVGNNLRGICHTGTHAPVPINKDHYGLAFFTRPQLCLSDRNLRNDRNFYNLLTTNPNSIPRYIRCMLDPRIMLDCPFIDRQLGFIPVLTNNITSMSGWPDMTLDTYTSPQGLRREMWSIVDSPFEILDAFDITCTFRNTRDEPIIMLMYYWCKYMSLVFEGMFSPYLDMITENEIDYNTRIYRLVLDETKRFVKKIAAIGAGFPKSLPFGRFFDFQELTPYNMQTKDIDITFHCMGANYNDPILIDEFNAVSGIFNPSMRVDPKTGYPSFSGLVQIDYAMLDKFTYRGYPYINPDTQELQWWISTSNPWYQTVCRAYGISG